MTQDEIIEAVLAIRTRSTPDDRKPASDRLDNLVQLNLTDIKDRYPDQWIALVETAWDERDHPTAGVLVATDPDRENLVHLTQQLHHLYPELKTFTFYTGAQIPEDLVVVL